MATIHKGRFTASIDEEIVLFLIGLRFNRPWKFWQWWGPVVAMPRMLKKLQSVPELGLLHVQGGFVSGQPIQICYFRSAEHLYRFATDPELPHLEPWRHFNQRIRDSGDVGVWHETYRIGPANTETIYANMPAWLLGAAVGYEPVGRRGNSARKRAGLTQADTPTVAPY